jgi:hypothetical protein
MDTLITYPSELDGPLNGTVTVKIRQYLSDYNNRPSNTISRIPTIPSTSVCLLCEFVLLIFLQTREKNSSLYNLVHQISANVSSSGIYGHI